MERRRDTEDGRAALAQLPATRTRRGGADPGGGEQELGVRARKLAVETWAQAGLRGDAAGELGTPGPEVEECVLLRR